MEVGGCGATVHGLYQARDVVFKLLHRVLPTRSSLVRWHLAPSGACMHGLWRARWDLITRLRPMSSILSVHYFDLSPKILPAFTLLEAVFCRNVLNFQSTPRRSPVDGLSLHLDAQERHSRSGTPSSAWHDFECTRHRQPHFEYYSSQWMPPGVRFPSTRTIPQLCFIFEWHYL